MNSPTPFVLGRQIYVHDPLARPARSTGIFPRLLAAAAVAAATIANAPAQDLTPAITNRTADGYKVATFTAVGTGTWTIPAHTGDLEVLVVGGGGGGQGYGGGGGAGGFNYTNTCAIDANTSVTVTVGAGAAGGPDRSNTLTDSDAPDGDASAFDTVTAAGGDGGHWHWTSIGAAGYGKGGTSGNGLVATVNDYGSGSGASQAGYDRGNGGAGLSSSITGSLKWYAGGGGSFWGAGGSGVGGAGHINAAGSPALANTGGGGGAGHGGYAGGAGGSGVVIVAYKPPATNYTVTFDSKDGSTVPSQTVIENDTADEPSPAPTKAGYTFVEWCSDDPPTTAFSFATPITSNRTLYAKWVLNCIVTFQTNDGSGIDSQSVTPGHTATLPAPAPTKTGCTFAGWYADVDLTNPFDFGTLIWSDTTLYAKWETAQYTVSFNSNGGTTVGSQTVDYNTTATRPEDPTKGGYNFAGWYADAGLAMPFDFGAAITSNTTLYAKWTLPLQSTITTNDTLVITTFTEGSGTWTVPEGVSAVDVLVVGGGGAGLGFGGGGGGGGFHETLAYPVTPGSNIAVAVGAGGAGGESRQGWYDGTSWQAKSGDASEFDAVTVTGGQGGHWSWVTSAGQGGASGTGFTAEAISNNYGSGSGAGAKGTANGSNSDAGGAGLSSAITGTTTWYGGGGGAIVNGPGGQGGGGAGGNPAVAGLANSGGGGGGGWGVPGAAGGSGVVIVVYQTGGQTPYQKWAAGTFAHAFTDTDPAHDPDGDGRTNQYEFAFGLDPTTGASADPISVPYDKSTHKFRYTRLKDSGLTYTVWVSTDLQDWGVAPAAASAEIVATVNDVETVEVTLTSPPESDKLFVRVKAQ